jgi:lysophospholipase L1-like esterase
LKKVIFLLLCVVILFLGYLLIFSPSGTRTDVIADDVIICFGDSLTYGTGASKGNDYPSQLLRMISRPVINVGVPGDTTASALKRLESDVLSRFPDVVLITLGGNDLKNGIGKESAFENLKKIVESIQNQGARVIIGGLKFPLRDRGFGEGYEELADQTGAILIPNILDGIMGKRSLMSDPIHPNNEGYRIVAERFYEAMLSH